MRIEHLIFLELAVILFCLLRDTDRNSRAQSAKSFNIHLVALFYSFQKLIKIFQENGSKTMVSVLDNHMIRQGTLFPDMNETCCPSGRSVRFSNFLRTRKEIEWKRENKNIWKWRRLLYWTSLGWWWNGSEINWKTNNSVSFPRWQ